MSSKALIKLSTIIIITRLSLLSVSLRWMFLGYQSNTRTLSSTASTILWMPFFFFYFTTEVKKQHHPPNHTSSSFGFIPYPYIQTYQQIQLFFFLQLKVTVVDSIFQNGLLTMHRSWTVFTWTITITIFHYLQLSKSQLIYRKTRFQCITPSWKLRKI